MKTTIFDISEILDDEEMIAEYLSAVIEENDTRLLLKAIGHIAKARGMSKIATDSGLGRESLYKALDENAQPRFETIMKVLGAINIKMNFSPVLEDKKSKKISRQKKINKKAA
jgi:probable addiction module antidote protein